MELLKQQIFIAAQQGSERLLLDYIAQLRLLLEPSAQGVALTKAVEKCLNFISEATIGNFYTTIYTRCTPLIIAICNNHMACVKVLLLHLHERSSVNKTDVRVIHMIAIIVDSKISFVQTVCKKMCM